MSPLPRLTLLLLFAAAATASAASLNGAAHDLLAKYGLPKGLIPDSVASYSFDEATGAFEIHLASPCYVRFADLVYYDKTITGKLSKGTISDLSGVQTKKLFAWLPITGMVAQPDKGAIEFQVGFLSEQLPTSMFDKPPTCAQRRRAAARRGWGDRGAWPAPVAQDLFAQL